MAILALLAVLGTLGPLGSESAAQSDLGLEEPKGGKCIMEEDQMRRTHMDFLRHKRAITVREGVRVKEESLLNCISCHPSRTKFCDRCHDYVGVSPDCFDCHNYPK